MEVRSTGDTPGSGLIVSEGRDATGVGRENGPRGRQVRRTRTSLERALVAREL